MEPYIFGVDSLIARILALSFSPLENYPESPPAFISTAVCGPTLWQRSQLAVVILTAVHSRSTYSINTARDRELFSFMAFTVIKWHWPLVEEKLILNLYIMLKNIILKMSKLKEKGSLNNAL